MRQGLKAKSRGEVRPSKTNSSGEEMKKFAGKKASPRKFFLAPLISKSYLPHCHPNINECCDLTKKIYLTWRLSITYAPMKQISALWSNSCNCRYPHLSYLFPKRTFSQILQRNGSIKSKFLYTICFFLPLETLNYRRIILANLTTMPNFKDTYSRSSQGNYNTRKGSNVHSIRDLNDTESIGKKKH